MDPDGAADGAVDLGEISGLDGPRFPVDRLDGLDDAADWYRFRLDQAAEVALGLRQLDADADLRLHDEIGELLGASETGGTANEWLKIKLPAGDYFVEVVARESGVNDYVFRYGAEPLPAGSVLGLVAEETAAGTLELRWHAASPVPADYRVNWAPSGEPFPTWTDESGNAYPIENRLTVDGLDAETEYKIRVRARYPGEPAGPWSDEHSTVTTLRQEPSSVRSESLETSKQLRSELRTENQDNDGADDGVLISTLDVPRSGTATIGNTEALAMHFQTGQALGGISLASVTVGFADINDNARPQAQLWSIGENGRPERRLYTFPTPEGGVPANTDVTFVAQPARLLDPETWYALVVQDRSLHLNAVRIHRTSGASHEDVSKLDDWSLSNGSRKRPWQKPWTDSFFIARALAFSLNGAVRDFYSKVEFADRRYQVLEGGTVTVTMRLDRAAAVDLTVPLVIDDSSTATAEDYDVPESVTFEAGEVEASFAVTAHDDDLDDAEAVLISLGELPGEFRSGELTETRVNIFDGSSLLMGFASESVEIDEGRYGEVRVALTRALSTELVIPIVVEELGGATSDDYTGVPSSVTVAAGELEAGFFIQNVDDFDDEQGEGLRLSFGELPAGVFSGELGALSSTKVVLANDDFPVVKLDFELPLYTVGENSRQDVRIVASEDPRRDIRFKLRMFRPSTTSGVARAEVSGDNQDICLAPQNDRSGCLDASESWYTIRAGETSVVVTLRGIFDARSDSEGDEQANLFLTSFPPRVTSGSGGGFSRIWVQPYEQTTFISNQGQGHTSEGVWYINSPDVIPDGTPPTNNSPDTGIFIHPGSEVEIPDDAIFRDENKFVGTWFETGDYPLGYELKAVKLIASVGGVQHPDLPIGWWTGFHGMDGEREGIDRTLTARIAKWVTNDQGYSYRAVHANLSLPSGSDNKLFNNVTLTAPENTYLEPNETYQVLIGYPGIEESGDCDELDCALVPYTTSRCFDVRSLDGDTGDNDGDGDCDEQVDGNSCDPHEDCDGWRIFNAGIRGKLMIDVRGIRRPDNPIYARFSAGSYSVTEGEDVDVTVTLDRDPRQTVKLPIVVTHEGGAEEIDYAGIPAALTFDAGETSKSFTITPTQDIADDDGESLTLRFGESPNNVRPGTGGHTSATVSIGDDDDGTETVELSFGSANYTVAERGGTREVTVRLSQATGWAIEVPLTFAHRQGISDFDYRVGARRVQFAGDQLKATFEMHGSSDGYDDDGEIVEMGFGTLPERVVLGTPATADLLIVDDDVPVVTVGFAQPSYSVTEGDTVDVEVVMSEAPERAVSVPILQILGAGAGAADYSGVPAHIDFAADQSTAVISFAAADDDDDDEGESVLLAFGDLPDGVYLDGLDAAAESVVSIVDTDEDALRVSFAQSHAVVPEGDSVDVSVVLSSAPSDDVAIPLVATAESGASAGDFSGVPASLTITSGATTASFSVNATDDSDDDDDETVRITFGTLPEGVVAHDSASTEFVVYLGDDDGSASALPAAVEVSFEHDAYSVDEGGTVSVTVELDQAPGREVVVPITSLALGGATAADYSGVPSTLTFGDADQSQSFTFSATADGNDDDGESVQLGFGALPPRLSAAADATSTVSINDDDDPVVSLSFAQASYSVVEGGVVEVRVELSADPERRLSIPIVVRALGDTPVADVLRVPDEVTFVPGQTSKGFTVLARNDESPSSDAGARLAFGDLPRGVRARDADYIGEATVTIVDNDTPREYLQSDLPANTSTPAVVEVETSLDARASQQIRSRITTTTDIDWIRVDLTQGQKYRIAVKGSRLGRGRTLFDPLLLGLYTSDDDLIEGTLTLGGAGGIQSLDVHLHYLAQQTGPHWIAVTGYAAEFGTYDVRVIAVDDDNAPDSADTQTTINVGDVHEGSIDHGGDIDWIAVELEAGTTYRATFANLGDDLDMTCPTAQFYRQGRYMRKPSDDRACSLFHHTARSTGTHYIVIRSFHYHQTGPYQLTIAPVDE